MTIRASAKTLVPGYQTKINFSRHILPPLMGILTFVALILIFNMPYLVANARFLGGSYQLHNIVEPVNKVQDNRVLISKINVNAPVDYSQTTNEALLFQLALQKGVVHYAGSSYPGQAGNVALFGHSSGVPWEKGDYKFVFTLLDKLQPGDNILIDYNNTRYIYQVRSKEVVKPADLQVLSPIDQTTHGLLLITCTPVGTSNNRLVVHAEQIYPAPIK